MTARLVLVGAGAMGRAWLQAIQTSPDAELVGIADLDPRAASAAAAATGRPDLPVGVNSVELARRTGADALVNVTVPSAHHPVTTAALFAGFSVLGEKPAAANLAQALSLAAAAQATGKLFMVSQSRRYNTNLATFRAQARALGPIGLLTSEFFRAARFGGFREAMEHPLLLDMAIHPFDTARYLLDADPESVYCDEFNPDWSWYAGAAATTAIFRMTGGVRYVYTGSWCSPGHETSWNGAWRLSAQGGASVWDGDNPPVSDPTLADHEVADRGESIKGALHDFLAALRTRTVPMGEIHDNVLSLAMVEAAVASARSGATVRIDDVLAEAHTEAIHAETSSAVAETLRSWTSARRALRASRPVASSAATASR